MKCMIVLSALVALSSAGIAPLAQPLAYATSYNPSLAYGYSTLAASPFIGRTVLSAPALAYSAPTVYSHNLLAAPAISHQIVASPVAAPAVAAAPVAVAPAVAGVKSQYHAQDELGQASYGHSEPTQAHSAVQDAHGNKVGSFSYVAPDGRVLRTDYVADALGYRVESNALPVGPGAGPAPVADTAEVVAARAAHLALHSRAKRDLVSVGHTPASTAPIAHQVVVASPTVYSAPFLHSATPLAYSAPVVHSVPLAYSPSVAYSSPLVREATLTTVVNNPGHAVSYRVD